MDLVPELMGHPTGEPHDLDSIAAAFAGAYSLDTCSPDDVGDWSTENAARGHCAVASLVVHDLLGGQLLRGDVHEHGEQIGYHWWNRLAGVDIDLTREQFRPTEIIGEPVAVDRPPGEAGNYADQYEVFRARVAASLGLSGDE